MNIKKLNQKLDVNRGDDKKEGFTLIELLVVIAIIAILAAVVAILINPVELTKRGRDSNRLTDLANMQQAINVAAEDNGTATSPVINFYCAGQTSVCGGSAPGTAYSVGTLGSGNGNSNATEGSPNAIAALDGTGWIKVKLSGGAFNAPSLPVDPTNSTGLHYTYCGLPDPTAPATTPVSSYEMATVLESSQYGPKMSTDGGGDNNIYEVGTNLNIIGFTTAPSGGCKY